MYILFENLFSSPSMLYSTNSRGGQSDSPLSALQFAGFLKIEIEDLLFFNTAHRTVPVYMMHGKSRRYHDREITVNVVNCSQARAAIWPEILTYPR